MKKYKHKLILEGATASVAGLDKEPVKQEVSKPVEQKKQSGGVGDTLSKILPLIIGIGGLSMLFGKGLFGIGSGKNGLFGGFWGKLIGGTALATVLPGLWSNQGIGDRLSGAFKKLTSGDIGGAFKTFLGIDGGADKEIKKTQEEVTKLSLNRDTIQAKAKQFTTYAVPFTNLLNWMKKSNHADQSASLIYLTPTVALTMGKTVLDSEKELNKNKTQYIALLFLNDQKQIQVQMAQVENLTGTINATFAKLVYTAMKLNGLSSGMTWLKNIRSPETSLDTWYDSCKNFVNGLNTIAVNDKGHEIILKLFNDGFTDLCAGHTLPVIDLPSEIDEAVQNTIKKFQLIYQDAEQSFSDLLNDPELAALKEDPTLNKFDEDIKLLDEQITDSFTKLIQMLLLNQNQEGKPIYQNPDACVIYGLLGKQHYFYCRDRENGYLTTDVSKSVIFPGSDIKKIESESPIQVSTGQHMSFETSIPILWKSYESGSDKDLKEKFDIYKQEHSDVQDTKELFKQFVKEHGESVLPFKKEKRDIVGNTIKETLQKFLIAVKLPQVMKIKKPGIKVNVYETNLAFIEKLKNGLKEQLNVDITQG